MFASIPLRENISLQSKLLYNSIGGKNEGDVTKFKYFNLPILGAYKIPNTNLYIQYAVFHYIGSGKDISNFYQNIFNVWLPNSAYDLDDRAHF